MALLRARISLGGRRGTWKVYVEFQGQISSMNVLSAVTLC